MDDFGVRRAPLEYWFLKVASGELAFLVDWIIRRATGQAEVRVSLWQSGRGRVLRATAPTWEASGTTVKIAGCVFTPTMTVGAVDDVRWDLRCDPGAARLDPVPLPARLLRPFDLQLVGRPRAAFAGSVESAGQALPLADCAGTLNHYWGRRLPDSWVWVSADHLGDENGWVEALWTRTRVWGAPGTAVTGGYVVVQGSGRSGVVLAPVYGRITLSGTDTSVEITARGARARMRLTATARHQDYNDLGEGIRQTLLGDVHVDGYGSCEGHAGLEIRGEIPPLGRGPR